MDKTFVILYCAVNIVQVAVLTIHTLRGSNFSVFYKHQHIC